MLLYFKLIISLLDKIIFDLQLYVNYDIFVLDRFFETNGAGIWTSYLTRRCCKACNSSQHTPYQTSHPRRKRCYKLRHFARSSQKNTRARWSHVQPGRRLTQVLATRFSRPQEARHPVARHRQTDRCRLCAHSSDPLSCLALPSVSHRRLRRRWRGALAHYSDPRIQSLRRHRRPAGRRRTHADRQRLLERQRVRPFARALDCTLRPARHGPDTRRHCVRQLVSRSPYGTTLLSFTV